MSQNNKVIKTVRCDITQYEVQDYKVTDDEGVKDCTGMKIYMYIYEHKSYIGIQIIQCIRSSRM